MPPAPLRRAAVLLVLPLTACLTDGGRREPPEPPGTPLAPDAVPAAPTPAVDTTDGADWLRLTSGEWIKGQLIVLDRETLQFKSAELGQLKVDWNDVAELRSERTFTLLVEGRLETVGTVRVLGDVVLVTAQDAVRSLPRADLVRMVPGEPRESNFWSGEVTLGGTLRRGNTDSLDYKTSLALLRRTARSRLPIKYDSAYGELEGVNNTDNERLEAQYDWFIGADLFVTPLGVELYRDQFQNIALRATPFTGLGYRLSRGDPVEWDVTAALGYRYTEYESVAPGDDDTDTSSTAILGTGLVFEPTATVDVELAYKAEIGLEAAATTDQTASLELSIDLWWDFDLDIRFEWDRIGSPEPDSDGKVPDRDDVQVSVGLSWSF